MSATADTSNQGGEPVRETTAPGGLTQETAFEVLSCRRRRHVLHCLKQRGGSVGLRELSTAIAAWENDVSVEEVTYDQRMRVYTALRQSHLPKMDDAGVVAFDRDRGDVELTDEATELEVYLDVVPHDEIPWSQYYLGIGLLSNGIVLVTWLGTFPFSELPPIGCAALIALLLTGSAVAHTYHDRNNRIGAEGTLPA